MRGLEPSLRQDKSSALALLFGVGGSFATIALVLPHPVGSNEVGIVGVAIAALTSALLLWQLPPDRASDRLIHVFLVSGTLLITLAIHMWRPGPIASSVALIYVWILLYAFYFFSTLVGVAYIGLCGGAYAVALAIGDGNTAAATQWMVTIGTATVSGVMIGRLAQEVHDLAATDPLTGVGNRRAWAARLDQEMDRAARTGQPLSVALGDLDDFKRVNDEHGHEAGDRVLADLAREWRTHVRTADVLARFGGDEFGVILPATSQSEAIQMVQRLVDAGRPQRSTFGVATWDGSESASELLGRADAAMYRGKSGGQQVVGTTVRPVPSLGTSATPLAGRRISA